MKRFFKNLDIIYIYIDLISCNGEKKPRFDKRYISKPFHGEQLSMH